MARGARYSTTSAFGLLLCVFAAVARADDVTPPVAVTAAAVPYPAGAKGDAAITVELVVGVDGVPRDARVLDDDGPLAAATLAAVPGWRFTPASSHGVPVAAKVRMLVDFRADDRLAPSAVAPASAASAGTGAAAPSPAGAESIVIRGARAPVGAIRLAAGEVRQIPGAFGDAFRAIESLPGVVPMASGIPYFFVRGAPPGNTGYYLDGVRVPLLFHLGFGPSVVHPAMVDGVDFFPGGFPAEYGRFAGGIVSARTTDPSPVARADAQIRLYDAGALAESPFGKDDRGDALVGARYSYSGPAVSIFAPDTRLGYWDYQARIGWKLTDRDRLSLFAFGSYDNLSQRDYAGQPFQTVFDTQFHRFDLRYDHRGKDGERLRIAATVGYDDSSTDVAQATDTMLAARLEYERPIFATAGTSLLLRGGADTSYDRYTSANTADAGVANGFDDSVGAVDETTVRFAPRQGLVGGLWADVVWKVSPRVELTPGVRADVFSSFPDGRTASASTAAVSVDPRLAARVKIANEVTLLSAFGITHQEPSFVLPIPGLAPSTNLGHLQTAVQSSLGVETHLPYEITATATGFLQDFLGMTDPTATCVDSALASAVSSTVSCNDQRVRGRAFGLELFVRRPLTKRITGWLSYTLSRSTRQAHSLFVPGEITDVPSEYDRTHVISAIGAVDLGRRWRAGAKVMAYSGTPYTQTEGGVPVPPYNSQRLPAFYRIDIRLEKSWPLGTKGHLAVVLEGLNITLQQEATQAECVSSSSPMPGVLDRCTPRYIGPVSIPSLGVEGSF